MRAVRQPVTARRRLARTGLAAVVAALPALAVLAVPGVAGAGTGSTRLISYLGYRFAVPRSWPVIANAAGARGCVRFDRHAVYLGAAAVNQGCPSWLLGTTEAILIQPGPAATPRRAVENPVARQITATAPGIAVTGTFGTDPTELYRILSSAGLPAPVLRMPRPAAAAAAWATPLASRGVASQGPAAARVTPRPPVPAAVANFRGLGFDACATPSAGYMAAWRRFSPYRAVGVYIGGSDRACAQPNLTAGWVAGEAAAGWRFIPLYVGPQAAFAELSAPASQGAAAAADAAAQAQRLGFGLGTPIYYDMEAYGPGSRRAALTFLSAWTTGLRRYGYASGVYSSSSSGVQDLAGRSGTGYPEPAVLDDALWNGAPGSGDTVLRGGRWAGRRIHQFSGNVTKTFGGATINIDQDFLDVALPQPVTTAQAGPATVAAGRVNAFFVHAGHHLWLARRLPGSGWHRAASTGASCYGTPSAAWSGRDLYVFCRGSAGLLQVDRFGAGGALIARHVLARMGVLGSDPKAVAQPGGLVDVFWRGSADDHLWHAQLTPHIGWTGAQGLGGALVGAPSPVVSSAGHVDVFWKGADSALWHAWRGLTGRWHRAGRLGMAPLGGPPRATAQPSGGVEVYWPGAGVPNLWEAVYQPGRGWHGAKSLGGLLASEPWPVSAAGTVRVLWRGRRGQMYSLRHRPGRLWGTAGWAGPATAPVGRLSSAPFATSTSPVGAMLVFWRGRLGGLWTATLSRGAARLGPPVNLGGG